jgi:SAM-dependent methyltransferase
MLTKNIRFIARRMLNRITLKIIGPIIEKYDHQLASERILENPYVTAKKLNPLEDKRGYYIISNTLPHDAQDRLPVPPESMWEGYGQTSEEYLSMGREHVSTMLRLLSEAGAEPERFSRILELGCAAGRMLRFLPPSCEVWGVDVKADAINWCQQNLPFRFATNTTLPHLYFEDNYFDLVYAGSVFTHIADQPDAWFLELRRIVRTGGYIYITIQDKHSVELIFSKYKDRKDFTWYLDLLRRFDRSTQVLSQDYGCFSFEGGRWGGFPVPQVFYDANYLGRKWSRFATLLSRTEEAYGWQTVLLFQK